MADNFDFKKFLVENKLGAYSKAGKFNEAVDPRELGAQMTHPDDMDDAPMDEPIEVDSRILTTDTGESFVVKRIEKNPKGEVVYIVDAPSGRAGMGASEFSIPASKAKLHPQQL